VPPDGVTLLTTRADADSIVYLQPPWPDAEAPDRLATFRPRELRRTFVFSQDDRPTPWAPGMYASVANARNRGHFTGGFYVLPHLRDPEGLTADLEAARDTKPDLLWSFMGTLSTSTVRGRLLQIDGRGGIVRDTQRFSDTVRWAWNTTHRDEGRQAFRLYAETLGRSHFVLCPRGRGAATIRLFEALQAGRCPVVISDDWLPPPFVDWESCSIQVAEADVARIPDLLAERVGEADELGRRARQVWDEFFSPTTQLPTLARACVEIGEECRTAPRLRLAGAALRSPSSIRAGVRKATGR